MAMGGIALVSWIAQFIPLQGGGSTVVAFVLLVGFVFVLIRYGITPDETIEGAHVVLEQSYGFDIDDEKLHLRVAGDELRIHSRNDDDDVIERIHRSDIDFEELSVDRERDFEAENRSRGQTHLSLFDSAMPAEKSMKSVVHIPTVDSNAFLVVSTSGNEDDLLDVVASLDPTV